MNAFQISLFLNEIEPTPFKTICKGTNSRGMKTDARSHFIHNMLLQALTQLTVTVSTIQEGGEKNKPWEVSLASEEADGSVVQ